MAEKLSVISLSYQMVEGLINNFKSNNWRAGQIHRHTHTPTLTHTHMHIISCLCKSPTQAQMHIIHTHLLIHTAQKSNRKAAIVLSSYLCTVPFFLIMETSPPVPPTVCEGDSWSGEEVLWMGFRLPDCKSHPADWILLASQGQ